MVSQFIKTVVQNIPNGNEDKISSMICRREMELEELTDNGLYCTEWGKTVEELQNEIAYLKKELERRTDNATVGR